MTKMTKRLNRASSHSKPHNAICKQTTYKQPACRPACQVSCCNAASPVAGWLGGWMAGWLGGWVAGRPACRSACVPLAQIEGGGRAERQACRSRHPPRTIFYFLTNTHVDALQTTARTSARTSARTCNRSNCPIGKRETVVL